MPSLPPWHICKSSSGGHIPLGTPLSSPNSLPNNFLILCAHASFPRHRDELSSPNTACKTLAKASADDDIWKELYHAKWMPYRRGKAWCAAAAAATESKVSGGSARSGHWRRRFLDDRDQAKSRLPIFAMQARIQIGRAFGMHFFEPRYRWLVQRAVEAAEAADEEAAAAAADAAVDDGMDEDNDEASGGGASSSSSTSAEASGWDSFEPSR